ncbi:MAG: sigma-70 family RNA polymerase sigma factor [Solobacterium sp.]|nr:sigma-70 family RNA polymerase sigma factor [Erysipelotrichaceae bacterium]MBR0478627.1 sigma-70 family RNA polymerase sigma factor [Solobacterium sp.]
MEDKEIVSLYLARDEDAIVQTDLKYGAYCRTIAFRILRDAEDVKECISDTWLKLWNSIPPVIPASLKHYAAKIIRNAAFDRYEADHTQKRGNGEIPVILDELAECIPSSVSVEEEVAEHELRRVINLFLRDEKERERNLFIRRYFHSETIEEIAVVYGMRKDAVASSLYRMRGRLKVYLENEGYSV